MSSGKSSRRLIQIEPPSVTKHIARTLERYPDGGQILKELIQNADDAEASEVKFILDSHQYSTDGLIHENLGAFQGPALYAWNNAIFKDDDWKQFGKIEESSKERDALKVGRFGVGFLSVFHITDLPVVISTDCAAILDPHKRYTGSDRRGWSSDLDVFLRYRGHAACFASLGSCSVMPGTEYYPATIFRFPLRQPNVKSEISSNHYPVERVRDFLFQSFIEEAPIMLLFLKHVEEISLYDGSNLIYKVFIDPTHKFIARSERGALIQLGLSNPSYPTLRLYSMSLCIDNFCAGQIRSCSYHWLICNMIGSSFEKIQDLSKKLQILPWVGIAAPLPEMLNISGVQLRVPDITQLSDVLCFIQSKVRRNAISLPWCDGVQGHTEGRAFCFLPLPNRTYLPVNIHGYFAVSDNRRTIEWPSFDNKSNKAIWNEKLILQHVAPLYSIVIGLRSSLVSYRNTPLPMSGDSRGLTDPYAAWPLFSKVKHKEIWSELVKPTVKGIFASPVFWSATGEWVSLQQAVFLPKQSNHPIPDKAIGILVHARVPIVNLPDNIWQTLEECQLSSLICAKISPSHVRNALKRVKVCFDSYEELQPVLEYILHDINYNNCGELTGLNLLPLATQKFTTQAFHCQSFITDVVYLLNKGTVKVLNFLPGVESSFVSPLVLDSQFLQRKFSELAQWETLQLRTLTPKHVCSVLLPRSIRTWTQFEHNKSLRWIPNIRGHPSIQWLNNLWSWLCKNPTMLFETRGLPILPQQIVNNTTTQCTLLPVPPVNKQYYRVQGSDEEEEKIASLLQKVGAVTLMGNSFVLAHPEISSFILRSSVPNLLQFLLQHGPLCIAILGDCEKDMLRELVAQYYYRRKLPQDYVQLLLKMPIFKVGVGSTPVTLRSLEVRNYLLPPFSMAFERTLYYPPILMDNTDKDVYDLVSKSLQYKVSVYDDVYIAVLQFAIKQCSSSPSWSNGDDLILWVMKVVPDLSLQLINFLSSKAFVRTRTNSLRKPSELYHPTEEQFRKLFDVNSNELFPSDRYVQVLHVLNKLGLKSWMSLVSNQQKFGSFLQERAVSVKDLSDNDAFERSCYIMELIGMYSRYSNQLMTEVASVKFVKVEDSPPPNYPSFLPWFGKTNRRGLESPNKMCYYENNDNLLVASVLPIMSSKYCQHMKIKLPFTATQKFLVPTLAHVLLQFHQLVSITEEVNLPDINEVSQMVHCIYQYLEMRALELTLTSLPEKWIWWKVNEKYAFTSAEKFVIHSPFNLRPFLYSIQSDSQFSRYRNLLQRSGICSSPNCEDLVRVLHQIKDYCSKEPLGEEYIKMSVLILGHLHKKNYCTEGEILLPTTDCTLCPVRKCTYDDREWIKRKVGTQTHHHSFVHESVPPNTARYFGVEPFSQKIAPSVKLGIKYTQVGQKERVTRRLRGIVNDYSGNIDIFKELIQNADDAKATEIKILMDWRQHGQESLFEEGMKHWQGPALVAYNNAKFSDQDFINICELANETKMSDPLKTGRFGVGFCACYSLTDVPSFISRSFLTIFDPHTKFLGDRVSYNEPGMRLNLVEEKADLKVYDDQFAPYNRLFGCDVFNLSRDGYKGTIFRFPLRMQGYPKSEISNDQYNPARVMNMIKRLMKEAEKLLLFLKHIKLLEVHELDRDAKDASEMKLLFKLVKKEVNVSSRLEMIKKYVDNPSVSQPPVCSSLRISMCGTESSEQYDYLLASALLPLSGLCKKGMIPLAELAIKMAQNGIPVPCKNEGQLFCFLPLPLKSCLPFHVNGFFDIGKDRQGLREAQDSKEHSWNKHLIELVLPTAFECALGYITTVLKPGELGKGLKENSLEAYYSLWPGTYSFTIDTTVRSWIAEVFVHSVKNSIPKSSQCLLWSEANAGKWISLSEAYLFEESEQFIPTEIPTEILTDAVQLLIAKPYSVIKCPKHVHRLIKNPIKELGHVIDYSNFFKDIFISEINKLHRSSRNKHLLFVMRMIYEEEYSNQKSYQWVKELLRNSKCIPVAESDSLAYPSHLIDSHFRPIAELYGKSEGRFAEDVFMKNNRSKVLISLGMISGELPIKELSDRAHTVSKVGKNDAQERTKNILKYISYVENHEAQSKYYSSRSSDDVKRQERILALSSVPFLKALPNPECQVIPWFHAKEPFLSPSELFSPEYKNLVFSQRPIFHPPEIDDEVEVLKLVTYLGIDKQVPSLDVVIDNICLLVTHLNNENLDESTCEFLDSSVFHDLYKFLNHQCRLGSKEVVRSKLASRCCVWQDRKLHLPSQMLFDWNVGKTCFPYLCALSTMNKTFEDLFMALGVEREPSIYFLQRVLSALSEEYKDEALSPEHLELVDSVTKKLSEKLGETQEQLDIFLPDENGVLQPSRNLTCDSNVQRSWVQSTSAFADFMEKGGHFIHKLIPRERALRLGAYPIIDAVLKDKEDTTFLDDTAFGQYEDLVDRLNGILKKYPPDESIFKEFIQNSDDAKATEIMFILDQRTDHPDSTLMSDGKRWKGLQHRPALCIFNNRPFTEEDIKGICKLGIGGKGDTVDTIGRFGIGFNVSYHLTDCPSFVSFDGTSTPIDFCAFDPLKIYCAQRSTRPGRRWKCDKNNAEQISDQFFPFLTDKFDTMQSLMPSCLQKLDKGFTMFRLPLIHWKPGDSDSGTDDSHDCDKWLHEGRVQDAAYIKDLLMKLKSSSETMLLFLNNVRNLSVFEIETSGKCIHYFTTSSVQISGSANPPLNPNLVKPLSVTCELKLTNHVADEDPKDSKWLVSKRMGLPSIPDVAEIYHLARNRGLDATGATATPLNSCNQLDGSLFFFLPIDIRSCLPVHLNAYFLLDDSRKHLGKLNQLENWNSVLAEHILVPSYVNLILHAKKYVDGSDESVKWFYSLFPDLNSTDSSAASELRINYMLYQNFITENHPILLDQRDLSKDKLNWLQITGGKNGLFCTNFHMENKILNSSEEINDIFVSLGIPITCAPRHVFDGLCKVSRKSELSQVGLVTEERAIDHLRKMTLNKECTDVIVKNCAKILNFCLQNCPEDAVRTRLESTPILLNSANALVTTGVLYDSSVFPLLPKCESWFIHQSLQSEEIGSKLRKGGAIRYPPVDFLAKHIQLPDVQGPVEVNDEQKKLIKLLWYHYFSCTQKDLLLLNNKPIIPSSFGNFYPPKLGVCVYRKDQEYTNVLSALHKLGYPTIDTSLVSPSKIPACVYNTISVPSNAGNIISSIQLSPPTLEVELTDNEVKEFISVLSHCNTFPPTVAALLRKLPLFQTASSSYCCFNEAKAFFFLPLMFPLDGLVSIQKNTKQIILKIPDDGTRKFYTQVIPDKDFGSGEVSSLQLYLQLIVPNFGCLTDNEMAIHLKNIKSIYTNADRKTFGPDLRELFDLLKNTPLITKNGKRILVSDLYNPFVKFHEYFNNDDLLPPNWVKNDWITFLSLLGLRISVDNKSWLSKARNVANEGVKFPLSSKPTRELTKKSEILIEALRDKILGQPIDGSTTESEQQFLQFLKQASEIKFIACSGPSETEVLLEVLLSKQPQNFKCFIKFHGSVCYRHQKLAGLSHVILPSCCDFLSEAAHYFAKVLSVRPMMTPELVVQNLIMLSKTLSSSEAQVLAPNERKVNAISKLKKIFEDHYKFLDEKLQIDSHSYNLLLKEKCLLLSDNLSITLVKPSQLVIHLPRTVSFQPFCFKVPPEFLKYTKLVKVLKIKEELEPIDYLNIMIDIKREMEYHDLKLLNQEEKFRSMCFRAYKKLIFQLRKSPNITLPEDQKVVLPSVDHELIDSSELVYNDMPWIAERIQSSKLKFLYPPPADEKGQTIPPACLRVKFLRTLAVEQLSESVLDQANRCADHELFEKGKRSQDCIVLNELTATLKSTNLIMGFERLYWHENHEHPQLNKQFCTGLKKLTVMSAQQNIYCVHNIKTIVTFEGKELPGAEDKSHLCYFKVEEKASLKLFVSHNPESFSEDLFLEQLSSLLKAQLGHYIKNEMPIKAMLQCHPTNINLELNRLKISQFDSAAQLRNEPMKVGTQLSIDDVSFRDEDLLIICNFDEGEKVLYHTLVNGKPVLKVGFVIKCLMVHKNLSNTSIRLHIDTIEDEEKTAMVSIFQVYKLLNALHHHVLSGQKPANYSAPLTLLPISQNEMEIHNWLTKVIKRNSNSAFCLMSHLSQRIIFHMHYLFVRKKQSPNLFLPAVMMLFEIIKEHNDPVCECDDSVVSLSEQFNTLSINNSTSTIQGEQDSPSLLDHLSLQTEATHSNYKTRSSKTTESPRKDTFSPGLVVNPQNNTPPPISLRSLQNSFSSPAPGTVFPGLSKQKTTKRMSRYASQTNYAALPPKLPPIDLVKAKAWLLQAKADYMAARDIFINVVDKDGKGMSLDDYTADEPMDIEQCFFSEEDEASDPVMRNVSSREEVSDALPEGKQEDKSDEEEEKNEKQIPQCKYPALVCFLCHDVVEKCIKGIMYAKCSLPNHLLDCRQLNTLCKNLVDSKLCSKQIEVAIQSSTVYLVEHEGKSRYPNYHYPTCAPACSYSLTETTEAMRVVSRLMAKLKESDMGTLIGELDVVPEHEFATALAKCIADNTETPEFWTEHTEEDGALKLELLDKLFDAEEYNVITSHFLSTLPFTHITRVERIQNKVLWRKYTDCAKRMEEKNNGKIGEVVLFHGTRDNKPDLIYKGEASFDMRFSNDGLWGRGNYFAVNASYSDDLFAHKCRTGQKQLLVAYVLTGYAYTCKSDKTLTQPPSRTVSQKVDIHYDSVSGVTRNSKVYITYNNDQAYPAYLITYT